MSRERKLLDFGGLDDFDPPPNSLAASGSEERRAIDRASEFPSRERSEEAQMNVRAPSAVLNRFRSMAKGERYTYGAFLEILMDQYEKGRKA